MRGFKKMSLYGSIGPQVPHNANIEYGAKYDGEYNMYHYQVGQSSYLVIYIPIHPGNCSKNNALYYSILSNINWISMSQYSNMSYVSHLFQVANEYYSLVNIHCPKYNKYMGKITKELYNLFEYYYSSQINILTKAHKYVSINLNDIQELFQLDIQDIYDPQHYIPQEYIKRRIDATPKPTISIIEEQNNIEQHNDLWFIQKKINVLDSAVRKREPQCLNAARYIANRRRRHI